MATRSANRLRARVRALGARPCDRGAREAIRFGWARTPLTRIISATAAGHLASRRVMEKCGLAFQAEITFRGAEVAWHAIDRPERGLPAGPSLGP